MPFQKLWLSRRSHDKSTQGHHVRVGVKTGKAQCEQMFSAVQPTTDIAKIRRHVRFVPTAVILMQAGQNQTERPPPTEAPLRSYVAEMIAATPSARSATIIGG